MKLLHLDVKSVIMRREHISGTESTKYENQCGKYKNQLWEMHSFRVRLRERIQRWSQGWGGSLQFTQMCFETKMRERKNSWEVFQEQVCVIFPLTKKYISKALHDPISFFLSDFQTSVGKDQLLPLSRVCYQQSLLL